MDSKIFVFLGFLGLSVVCILIITSVSSLLIPSWGKILLLILALFFDGLAFSSRFYSYLLIPVIKQRKRNLILSREDAYWLATSQDSIIHKEGEDYIATVYIRIPLYRSATEMTNQEKVEFSNQIARLVGMSVTPVRFTSQMHIMNKDQYISTLRATMNDAELDEAEKRSSGTATETELDRVRGRTSMWQHMLDNVSKTTSLELVSYATISSKGTKEFEAVSIAQQKAREVMSGIAAVFGISPNIVTGEGILKFVEPEFLIPYSTVSEQITKTMREEVA